MNKKINISIILVLVMVLFSCSGNEEKSNSVSTLDVATNPEKDAEIQKYNLGLRKARSERFPCDTISVIEYFLNNYPAGTYLLETDKTTLESIPKPAVIYFDDKAGNNYIFAVIGTSRSGERLIETKNLVGYNQSYIDLDSTKLGTPLLYLVLLECNGNKFSSVWDMLIPSHGGFKDFKLKYWEFNSSPFIEVNFYFAQGIGTISYNYFFVNDIREKPHLLMTYNGVDFKRTIANINSDKYPDYYEYIYVSLQDRIYARDSVAFIWNDKIEAYINTRNSKQTRLY